VWRHPWISGLYKTDLDHQCMWQKSKVQAMNPGACLQWSWPSLKGSCPVWLSVACPWVTKITIVLLVLECQTLSFCSAKHCGQLGQVPYCNLQNNARTELPLSSAVDQWCKTMASALEVDLSFRAPYWLVPSWRPCNSSQDPSTHKWLKNFAQCSCERNYWSQVILH